MAGNLRSIRLVRIAAAGVATAMVLFSLTEPRQMRAKAQAAAAHPQSFEVASIRPSAGVNGKFIEKMGITPGGRWTASAISAGRLIQIAYDLKPYQISGGPVWLEKERFDIVAKADMPGINPEQLKVLLRSLLAERFGLRFHRETRMLPIYALLVGKNGHKLRESTTQPDAQGEAPAEPSGDPAKTPSPIQWRGKSGLDAQKASISALAPMLGLLLDRPVIDKTGLDGDFDFSLHWVVDETALLGLKGDKAATDSMMPNAPSGSFIFKAVQDQLGLKLEPQKSAVEVLVIDRIEKVSGN